MSELPTERPAVRQMDQTGADAETLVDMGVLEPQPEPAPPEPIPEPPLQENPS
ncbi:hypothetical protein HW130_02910 [Streptomyces sp. PKU-EA00015]|uniref:hypothetical protein n=1 Tax=Streptomyces sp. PKU-EA00015 TaxID=2748326 RepID=UPI0015A0DAA2|nr:hypothetical protein [Streptomyces sp. PKU-EA00015]NWF25221.1 hypothetical protein [Streptomyces sp. PKU-EA00015]